MTCIFWPIFSIQWIENWGQQIVYTMNIQKIIEIEISTQLKSIIINPIIGQWATILNKKNSLIGFGVTLSIQNLLAIFILSN